MKLSNLLRPASRGVWAAAAVALSATPVLAEPAKIDPADTAWMLTATGLVLMMTIPGLALFYCGMVRKKNILATMAQSFAAVALGSLIWLAFGYNLAFTGEGAYIGSFGSWFLTGIGMNSVSPFAKTIPEILFMIYQCTFAVITVALVGGAVAERMKFPAFLLFSALWLVFVYVPIAHWVWGGGFLAKLGRARLRRRHRGAHQCRRRRASWRPRARQAARLRHGESRTLRSFDGGGGRGPALGRLVRLQRRLGLCGRLPRGDGHRLHAFCRQRRRADLGGVSSGSSAASPPCSA